MDIEFGQMKSYKKQEYLCVGAEPHVRRDGSETTLLLWESHCATCGAVFRFKTPAAVTKFQPNRRCDRHKRRKRRRDELFGARGKSSW